jgi:hypothetical protein
MEMMTISREFMSWFGFFLILGIIHLKSSCFVFFRVGLLGDGK